MSISPIRYTRYQERGTEKEVETYEKDKYIHGHKYTRSKGKKGKIAYILEYIAEGYEPATLTKIEDVEDVTENKAHLLAITKALSRVRENCEITLYIESGYIASNIGKLEQWEQAGWKNAKNKDIANKELWKEMLILLHANQFLVMEGEKHPYRQWMKSQLVGGQDENKRCNC